MLHVSEFVKQTSRVVKDIIVIDPEFGADIPHFSFFVEVWQARGVIEEFSILFSHSLIDRRK